MTTPDNPSPTAPVCKLDDVQGLGDTRGVALSQVGINEFEMPLTVVQKAGGQQHVAAKATMSVNLTAEHKGTHMSRFVMLLDEWRQKSVFCLDLQNFLLAMRERLHAEDAYIDLSFRYFIDKAAPVTGLSALMAVDVRFHGELHGETDYSMVMGLSIPISTLCPCSKAISDFGAHNQRALIHADISIDAQREHPMPWIEDLVTALEACGSCPVYPLLKRVDEKWVTEQQYTNAKFVEDVAREATLVLRDYPGVNGFAVEIEALESIHGHNAWTRHSEGVLSGLPLRCR